MKPPTHACLNLQQSRAFIFNEHLEWWRSALYKQLPLINLRKSLRSSCFDAISIKIYWWNEQLFTICNWFNFVWIRDDFCYVLFYFYIFFSLITYLFWDSFRFSIFIIKYWKCAAIIWHQNLDKKKNYTQWNCCTPMR